MSKKYPFFVSPGLRFGIGILALCAFSSCSGPESGYQSPPSSLPVLLSDVPHNKKNVYYEDDNQQQLTSTDLQKVSNYRYTSNGYGTFATYKIGTPYYIKNILYTPSVNYHYDQVGVASWYGPQFQGKKLAAGGYFDMNKISAAHKTLPLPSLVLVTNLSNGRSLRVLVNDRGPYAKNRIIDLSKKAADILGYKNKGTARVRVQILAKESALLRYIAQTHTGMQKTVPNWMINDHSDNSHIPLQQAVAQTGQSDAVPYEIPVNKIVHNTNNAGHRIHTNTVSYHMPTQYNENDIATLIPYSPSYYIQTGAYSSLASAQRNYKNLLSFGHVIIIKTQKNGKTLYKVRVGPYKSIDNLTNTLHEIKKSHHYQTAIVKLTR